MTRIRVFIAGAAVVSLAGCSLIAGLGQFDGATDALADAGPAGLDRSSPAEDSARPADESAVDGVEAGATNDGSPFADGSTDASSDVHDARVDGPESGPDWCATVANAQTLLCKDFDDGKAAAFGWSSTYFNDPPDAVFPPDASRTVTIARNDFVSPPAAGLLVTPALPKGATGDQVFGQLVETFVYHSLLTLRFSVKIPDYDPTTNASLVRVNNASNSWSWSYGYTGDVTDIEEGNALGDAAPTFAEQTTVQPNLSQWTDVAIVMNLSTNQLSISYDGTPVPDPLTLASPGLSGQGLQIILGVNYMTDPAASPMHIYYDNIDLEAQ